MKELSLNILDISQNSLKAGAKNISILIDEFSEENTLIITIIDDGCGMSAETLQNVTDPFCTSRKTRKVGLGIPFFKLAAEQSGGYIAITSKTQAEFPDCHGTVVKAVFKTNSIDFTPLGDIISTLTVLIQGSPSVNYFFKHTKKNGNVVLDTREIKDTLGFKVSIDNYEVLEWIKGFLMESYDELNSKTNPKA